MTHSILLRRFRRTALLFTALLPAAACGTEEKVPPEAAQEPDRSTENAIPPVQGEPLDGIFVSSEKGHDVLGDGSEEKPLATLAAAIALAERQQVRVYACGTFKEAVVLRDGVSVYGDVDCSKRPWVLDEAKRAVVTSPTTPALSAAVVTKATRVEGFEIVAPDATTTDSGVGGSSIAAFIRDSKELTIAKGTLRAGKGGDGVDGVEPEEDAQVQNGEGTGTSAQAQGFCTPGLFIVPCAQVTKLPGSLGGTRTCKVGGNPGPGGRGGDGRVFNNGTPVTDPQVFGGDGLIEHGQPTVATAQTAKGGVTNGAKGEDGAPGDDGPSGSNGVWSFGAEGFVPGNGTNGELGKPGQGGGGGAGQESWCVNGALPCTVASPSQPASTIWFAASGAGGGAGGCAGVPGTAGKGGGASVGLVAWKSAVTLEGVEVYAGKGGRAGKGAIGMAGMPGANGGAAAPTTERGGRGGRGGHGGLSGHGAPGPSIGIVETPPANVAVQGGRIVPGEPGEGQSGFARDGQIQAAVVGEAHDRFSVVAD